MTARAACLALVVLTLAACAPAKQLPTPTLIVLGLDLPTTTPVPTALPRPTQTPTVFYTATPTIEPPPTHTPSATPTASPTPRIFGTPSPSPATCQGTPSGNNLLANGGFEGGQHQQDANSVQVPDSWTAYWRPIGTPLEYDLSNHDGYQRPDMMVIPKQPPYTNPARVMEGVRAFMMSGNQRAFDAGIYQVVTVPPGAILCLTGNAQAWSNRYTDDPFSSTLDTVDDAHNANMQLGFDPQGGTDPYSISIRWGSATNQYNLYKPMSVVQFTAPGPSITVFVHGFMLWRFDHNELYFDGISLMAMTPETSTPTPGGSTPTPGGSTPTPAESTQPPR